MFYNKATTNPEIKYYKLKNNLNNDELYVTDKDLEQAFAPDVLSKIMSNRHPVWFVEDVN